MLEGRMNVRGIHDRISGSLNSNPQSPQIVKTSDPIISMHCGLDSNEISFHIDGMVHKLMTG